MRSVLGPRPKPSRKPFAVLTLEQVYGAITFYLAHREDVHRYLAERRKDFEAKREAAREVDPIFYQKLADAKRQTTPQR